jgi:surfactin synthase thioesterase subunit
VTGPWIDLSAVGDQARTVLVMVPYAGAVRAPTAGIAAALGPQVCVLPVGLPGHGWSGGGQALRRPEDVVAGVLSAVQGLAGHDVVLCGYSMGARIAFEVARGLHETGPPAAGLIVCMSRGPHTGLGHPPVSHLDGGEFVSAAVEYGLAAPALARLPVTSPLVTALHADMCVVERFPPVMGGPLPVPTAVIGARGDWLVPEPALRGWQDIIEGPLINRRIDGGHLAIQDPGGAFAAAVAAVLPLLLSRERGMP